jgi:hypothetical protein
MTRLSLLPLVVGSWLAWFAIQASQDKGQSAPADEIVETWLKRRKDVKLSTLPVRLAAGATVKRTDAGLVLPVTIFNDAARDITTKLAHEWHGGSWPSTDLAASVTPKTTPKAVPFHPAFLIGEQDKLTEKTIVPAKKSVTVEVRMDWPGTGSDPTEPFMSPKASGRYRVRLMLMFEADQQRQFIASPEQMVELPNQ